MIKHQLQSILETYRTGSTSIEQSARCKEYLEYLIAHVDACNRNALPGHFVFSVVVLDTSLEYILLNQHKKYKRWNFPGGHIEASDRSIVDVIRRELIEETGLSRALVVNPTSSGLTALQYDEAPPPLYLDLWKGDEAHVHYGLTFLAISPKDPIIVSNESDDVRWICVSDARSVISHPEIAAILDRTTKVIKDVNSDR